MSALSITPSQEQAAIVEFAKKGHSIVGDCVAGSGKTTSVLLVASSQPDKRILLVTYNKALKFEVRKKAQGLGLTNIEIHTYNSLCVKYYDREGYNNEKLRQALMRNAAPLTPIPAFDLIVLDESQDMNILFYGLVRKFIKDAGLKSGPQMLVLGDKYQSIYGFLGADSRFLTLCHELWDGAEFVPLSLSTSYRVTHSIANFVNDAMIGHRRMQAARDGPPVEYIVCDPYKSARRLCEKLVALVHSGAVSAGDIFVLAPSIKNSAAPSRLLENRLVGAGLPCYYPVSDEAQLDEEIIEGKVVFSTFHQSKGRERKLVIVYGFDNSYFKIYNSEANPLVCPEPLYVATTRARERLILLQGVKEEPLPFLQCDVSSLPSVVVEYYHTPPAPSKPEPGILSYFGLKDTTIPAKPPASAPKKHKTTPTALTAYLKESNIALLTVLVGQVFSSERGATYMVDIPSKITFDGGNCEDVSDINGIAIPAIYEARLHGTSTIERIVRQKYEDMRDEHPFLRDAYKRLGTDIRTGSAFLQLTIMYISFVEHIYNKLTQITHHNWLTGSIVSQCFQVLGDYITEEATFEEAVMYTINEFPEFGSVCLEGRIDAFDKTTLFEIKCVDALTLEHKLQLLIYAWIWKKNYEDTYGERDFKMINARTGEVLVLDGDSMLLDEAVYILLKNKFSKTDPVDDAQFVESCRALRPARAKHVKQPLFVDDD